MSARSRALHQLSVLAIARTTSYLLGLLSRATLLALRLRPSERAGAASRTWYRKQRPTVSYTLAAVRCHI
jgi:hypothetical protein